MSVTQIDRAVSDTFILETYIEASCLRVNTVLEKWLDAKHASRLHDAMRYSVFNGGKRIRPVLVYAAAQAISDINVASDAAAAAIECIHAYSLIHDDLPAMDNDDLRRGKPTCHIAFDEATAILAGDALQTLAFENLIDSTYSTPVLGLELMACLAKASGDKGMVYGQMLDILAEGQSQDIQLAALETIHRHKTGALIDAAVFMGAKSVGATERQLVQLKQYSRAIGLAFQVQDDILDVVSDTQTLGKKQGADIALGKSTYVSLLGLEKAQEKALQLRDDAMRALDIFGIEAEPLRAIADYIVSRKS